jgi:mannose-6-phosphate isomerase-like protein (cupin superfamily)
MIEHIEHAGELMAIIIRSSYRKPGITFVTDPALSQQVAYMQHARGKLIEPHLHNRVQREVHLTQEVLILRKGRMRVDFYDGRQSYLHSRTLEAGDVILLISGGHGFEVLDDLEMFEVKQGPYAGDSDKTRFPAAKTVRGAS